MPRLPLHDSHLTHPEFSLRTVDSPAVGYEHKGASKSERSAARKQVGKGTRRIVLQAIVNAGSVGLTREETSNVTGLKIQSVCGRVRDCVKEGWVYESGKTRLTSSNEPAAVLVASDAGVRQVRRAS